MPDAEPTLEASLNRVLNYADRLGEALEDLDDAGGIKGFYWTGRNVIGEMTATKLVDPMDQTPGRPETLELPFD